MAAREGEGNGDAGARREERKGEVRARKEAGKRDTGARRQEGKREVMEEQNKRQHGLAMLKGQLAIRLLQNGTPGNVTVISGLISSLTTVSTPIADLTNDSTADPPTTPLPIPR